MVTMVRTTVTVLQVAVGERSLAAMVVLCSNDFSPVTLQAARTYVYIERVQHSLLCSAGCGWWLVLICCEEKYCWLVAVTDLV